MAVSLPFQGTHLWKLFVWSKKQIKHKMNWKNDKKHGVGIMIYSNGDKYEGDWLNDKRLNVKKDWVGELIYSNGVI